MADVENKEMSAEPQADVEPMVTDAEVEKKKEEKKEEEKKEEEAEKKEEKKEKKAAPKKKKEEEKKEEKKEKEEEKKEEKAAPKKKEEPKPKEAPAAAAAEPAVLGVSRAGRKVNPVERFAVDAEIPVKQQLEILEGKGTKLGDIDQIADNLSKYLGADPLLKLLHSVVFHRPGEAKKIKANLRAFSGFVFTDEAKERASSAGKLQKATTSQLRDICSILCLERGGDKQELVDKIMGFLENPTDKRGKKAPAPAKKEKAPAKKEEKEEKKEEKKAPAKKEEKKEAKPESKKRKKSEDGEAAAPPAKKAKADNDDNEDDDKPLVQKQSDANAISDADLKDKITEILKAADLSEITKNKVFESLNAHYGVDISERKKFIAKTINDYISSLEA